MTPEERAQRAVERGQFWPTEEETEALMVAARAVGATEAQLGQLRLGWFAAGYLAIPVDFAGMTARLKRTNELAQELVSLLEPSLEYGSDEGLAFRSELGDVAERILPDLARIAALSRAGARRAAEVEGLVDVATCPKERGRVVQRCFAEWHRLGQSLTQGGTWIAFANAFVLPINRCRRDGGLKRFQWTDTNSAKDAAQLKMRDDGVEGTRGPKTGKASSGFH